MGKEDRHRRPHHKISGLTGELLTAVELLRHGFTVSWPLVDVDGYDLLSDDGLGVIRRLQVKTCDTKSSRGTYRVLFAKGSRKKVKYTKDDCDFVVAVIMYPSGPAFYVVPIETIESGTCHYTFWPKGKHPRFPRRRHSCKLEEYLNEWNQLT